MVDSKAKGARFESDVTDYLAERGWSADRQQQRIAGNDRPDVMAMLELTPYTALLLKVECKNRRDSPLSLAIGALAQARSTKGPGIPVAVIKVPGKNVSKSLAVMDLDAYLDLVEAVKR